MRTPLLLGLVALILNFDLHADTLTLLQAQAAALEHAYAIRTAQLEKDAGRFQRNSAIGSYFPSVSLATTHTWSESPRLGIPGDTAPPAAPAPQQPSPGLGLAPGAGVAAGTGWSHQITIAQPITNGGSEIVAIMLARNGLNALEFQREAAAQDALLQVRTAYFNAIVARERRHVDSLGLLWARRSLESATVRHESGVLPPSDLLRWQAEVQDRAGQVLDADAGYGTALRNLFLAIGIADSSMHQVSLQPLSILETLHEDSSEIPEAPVDSNPSYRAAQAGTETARNNATLTFTTLLPRVNGFFTLGWPAQPQLIPEGQSFWSAGVQIEVPLMPQVGGYFDYLRMRADRQRSQVTTEQTRHQLDATIRNSKELYAAAFQSVAAARTSRDLMARALEIVEQRYQSGLANQLELLETRLSADQAHTRYASALARSLVRKAEYQRSMGTLRAKP